MTLIKIIELSLIGFSAIFVLSWIILYTFFKIKRTNNQSQNINELKIQRPDNRMNMQVLKASPVFIRQEVNPILRQEQLNKYYSPNNNSNFYYNSNNLNQNNRQKVRFEKFVVFNKNQYSFYNI